MKIYKVSVFNTVTRQMEEVVVSKEVYTVYMQTQWQMTNDNRKYRKFNKNISELDQGFDEYFENMDSFVEVCDSNYREKLSQIEMQQMLHKALKTLPEKDRKLIQALYYEGYTEKTYAEKLGVSQQSVNEIKTRILRDLKKVFSGNF